MKKNHLPVALTVAGSDSGGCAGIQADLRTFAALGVHGASVIASVTAQNTWRVTGVFDLPPEFVAQQIDAVCEDLRVDAVKTGMLSSAANVEIVADRFSRWKLSAVVVDPVMVATSGARLIDEAAVESLIRRLFPLASLITPNRREAEALTGRSLESREDLVKAGKELLETGAGAVLIKGGHAEAPDATDLLFVKNRVLEYSAPRIDTPHTHGSGCTLAAAVAAGLAQGRHLEAAVTRAKEFVTEAIRHGYPLGHGHGPLGHCFRFWPVD